MFIKLSFFNIREEKEPRVAEEMSPTLRQKHLDSGGLAAALDPVSVLLML